MTGPGYRVTAHTPASPSAVYAVIADVPRWAEWQLIDAIAPAGPADGRLDPVGTEWVLTAHGRATRIRITEAVPGRRLGYTALSMPMFRDYRATIECAWTGSGGTDIVWHATFRPQVPGTGPLLRWYLRRYMGKVVASLARRALTPGERRRS
jgi:hypothetical protein